MKSKVPGGMAAPAYHETPLVISEVLRGEGLSLAQAARALPSGRGRGRLNPTTLWRWSSSGARSKAGRRIFLEVARLGCRIATSRPALARFISSLDDSAPPEGAAPESPPPPPNPHVARRAREVASARAALRARGMD
jgi:hypothetical protein